MQQHDQRADESSYPLGRGYGHDYMRGGELEGGYGYSKRPEYERRRGEADADSSATDSGDRRRSSDLEPSSAG